VSHTYNYFLGGELLLRVVYIQILYNTVYKLHLKYTFLRCLTMGSMACYQYMRSPYNRRLLVISVSHLLSRVYIGAGIEVLFVKVTVFILLLFASLHVPDCCQNQTAVSDEQYSLSDF
jgi:hypothetical protein